MRPTRRPLGVYVTLHEITVNSSPRAGVLPSPTWRGGARLGRVPLALRRAALRSELGVPVDAGWRHVLRRQHGLRRRHLDDGVRQVVQVVGVGVPADGAEALHLAVRRGLQRLQHPQRGLPVGLQHRLQRLVARRVRGLVARLVVGLVVGLAQVEEHGGAASIRALNIRRANAIDPDRTPFVSRPERPQRLRQVATFLKLPQHACQSWG